MLYGGEMHLADLISQMAIGHSFFIVSTRKDIFHHRKIHIQQFVQVIYRISALSGMSAMWSMSAMSAMSAMWATVNEWELGCGQRLLFCHLPTHATAAPNTSWSLVVKTFKNSTAEWSVITQPWFLGPRGPLRVPSFVRPFFRKKNLNHR